MNKMIYLPVCISTAGCKSILLIDVATVPKEFRIKSNSNWKFVWLKDS